MQNQTDICYAENIEKGNQTITYDGTDKINYGIEILRIVAMFMIVVLHVCGVGGVASGSELLSSQYMASWIIIAVCYCSVNVYALISGYTGYKSKFKLSKMITLWLTVVSLDVINYFIAKVHAPESISSGFFDNFFPLYNNKYWYFTAYMGLMIIMPVLNAAIKNLTKKQYAVMLIGMLAFYVLFPEFKGSDMFNTNTGYSMLWLMIMYLTGGFFGVHFKKKIPLIKTLSFILFVFSVSIMCFERFWREKELLLSGSFEVSFAARFSYTSVFVVFSAVFLLLIFSNINIKNKYLQKTIKFFSASTFGIYIVHTNSLFWNGHIWLKYTEFGSFETPKLIFSVIITAVCIFVTGFVIEKVRELVFKALFIKKITSFADKIL